MFRLMITAGFYMPHQVLHPLAAGIDLRDATPIPELAGVLGNTAALSKAVMRMRTWEHGMGNKQVCSGRVIGG